MDSLFISELTPLSIYIINAEHMFSIYERESYFRVFYSEGGDIFLCMNHCENYRITEPVSSTKGQRKTRTPLKELCLLNIYRTLLTIIKDQSMCVILWAVFNYPKPQHKAITSLVQFSQMFDQLLWAFTSHALEHAP